MKGAAAADVAAHPELKKDGGLSRLFAKLGHRHAAATPAPAPPEPPTPPPAPAATAPKPPAADRAEPPVRAAARSASPVVIRERGARAIPYPTEREADDAALKEAADRLARKLGELDPPVDHRPTPAVVKNEYARRDDRVVRQPTEFEKPLIRESGYGDGRVYVEYTVEVTAEQVRELRTHDRVAVAFRLVGVVAALAVTGFVFLRLDAWSKGILTSWLAFAAVALAGGVVAALVFV